MRRVTFVRHEEKPEGLYLTGNSENGTDVEFFVPATMVGIIGMVSQQSTLQDALNISERAAYTSVLFVTIVQDRAELGGGYGVQVIELDDLYSMHFETLEEVEAYLAENTPYTANSSVWIPLPHYNFREHESDFLIERTTR